MLTCYVARLLLPHGNYGLKFIIRNVYESMLILHKKQYPHIRSDKVLFVDQNTVIIKAIKNGEDKNDKNIIRMSGKHLPLSHG